MNLGAGRASYSTVHYYKRPQPYITLHRPSRWAYWFKAAFEKYWLKAWF